MLPRLLELVLCLQNAEVLLRLFVVHSVLRTDAYNLLAQGDGSGIA